MFRIELLPVKVCIHLFWDNLYVLEILEASIFGPDLETELLLEHVYGSRYKKLAHLSADSFAHSSITINPASGERTLN